MALQQHIHVCSLIASGGAEGNDSGDEVIRLNHSVLWLIKRCDLWQEGSTDKYMDGCMDKWKAAEVSREEFAVLTKLFTL
jgi:hypothetical protein